MAQLARARLPGDTGQEAISRKLVELNSERSSASREVALGALQIWQTLAESQNRGRGDQELTIVFTDLVDFSRWALGVSDDDAVELLDEVARVVEGEFEARGGRIVKRLGDGVLATFRDADDAVRAAWAAQEGLAGVEVAGHRPLMRIGMHTGKPRRVKGDVLGVDVNVAARVADAAGARDVLVSETTLARLDPGSVEAKKRRWFRAKGTPKGLEVHCVSPAQAD